MGSCSGFARIGAIVTPFIAQVLLKISIYAAISIYGTIAILAAIASYFLPVETKGREMKVRKIFLIIYLNTINFLIKDTSTVSPKDS